VADLAERLTLAGLEVAGVRVIGLPLPEGLHSKGEEVGPVWDRDKIVVGEVLGVDRHPNADRLTVPTVGYGQGRTKTLVTGAPNIKVGDKGQKVVVALAGSVLYDGHAEEKVLKELKPTKIRGVPSDAMVCSFKELGISDEHEGIILLEEDAPVGMPLADFMGDIVLELDVTPNMARCLSMIGVAREVAALFGTEVKLPTAGVNATGPPIAGRVQVAIEDPQLSARYAAALILGVTVGSAPGWVQRRLDYAGMRPINNIVDVTNYVMLEWGQPLHAFDHDLLQERARGKAPIITVRPARAGETLTTLDGQVRVLRHEDLVIADVRGPIALAGVMGGADTEVSPRTKNVLLESANFDFVSIRRTMKAFNLPSEASVRFSRGIHPETVRPAAERAADLMARHAAGSCCQGLVDCYPAPLPPQTVSLEMREVRRLLGMDLPKAEVVRILRALEFDVKETGPETLQATVPPHRLDVQAGSADLIEDLVRIHGYDRLPATLLADRLPEQHTNVSLVFEERVRDILIRAGVQEVITYSLTMPEREAPLGLPVREYIRLKNPISSERVVLRQSVLAGVLEVAAANLRHTAEVRLFEVGPVYLSVPDAKFPEEPRRLALLLTGRRQPEFWSDSSASAPNASVLLDFFDVKGIVEALAADLHLPEVTYQPVSTPSLHPGRSAALCIRGKQVGDFGQLHPTAAQAYGLKAPQVLVAELDLEAIQAALPDRYTYTPVPRFPAALRDIAVIVDETVSAEKLASEIRAAGAGLVRSLRLFDLYRGGAIPEGKKSLAFALSYQADDRTLTDKEVDKAHKKIEDRLKHLLKAQIRGQENQ
jgi:phenylalanyl-tRNA synthetase beta chain